jgi:hypothetical protein
MTPESQSRRSLLNNVSVNSFLRQRISNNRNYCWAIMMETEFSVGSVSRLYSEDPRPIEIELRTIDDD